MYTNQKTDVDVKWTSKTSKIAVNKAGQDKQNLYSWIPTDVYEGSTAPELFNGVQFHFHAGSEHTVDGKRHDLEMHTVHLPVGGAQNGIKYAALGIMFSVEDYTVEVNDKQQLIIDDFFAGIDWATELGNPLVDEVGYGSLMEMVDTNDRWVYKGSVTTPPCDSLVYWNVVRKVYPISSIVLNDFKRQLKRGDNKLVETGNWREVLSATPEHDVRIIQNDFTLTRDIRTYMSFFLVSLMVAVLGFIVTCCSMGQLSVLKKEVEAGKIESELVKDLEQTNKFNKK